MSVEAARHARSRESVQKHYDELFAKTGQP